MFFFVDGWQNFKGLKMKFTVFFSKVQSFFLSCVCLYHQAVVDVVHFMLLANEVMNI